MWPDVLRGTWHCSRLYGSSRLKYNFLAPVSVNLELPQNSNPLFIIHNFHVRNKNVCVLLPDPTLNLRSCLCLDTPALKRKRHWQREGPRKVARVGHGVWGPCSSIRLTAQGLDQVCGSSLSVQHLKLYKGPRFAKLFCSIITTVSCDMHGDPVERYRP